MTVSEPREPSDQADVPADVLQLQELGMAKGSGLGHLVGGWEMTVEDGGAGWRATCSRCGAVVYIRQEHGLMGIAGQLILDPCPQAIRAVN
jgi:hypothetical protein